MIDLYDRHYLIPGWRQETLGSATVVVLGVGAIGNEVARLLAMAGVGTLILCDSDHVDVTNLSRTVLFRRSDAEKRSLKVDAAARTLADLASGTRVIARSTSLVHGVGLAELRDAQLVISCLDSRMARLQVAGRCSLVGAPWLDGGTSAWSGEIRPYLDPDGPCYGCTLGAQERAVVDAPWSCADVQEAGLEGSSALLSAAVGAQMGTLAIRFLMGLSCTRQIIRLDATTGECVLVNQRLDPECPLHRRVGAPVRVPIHNGQTVGGLLGALPAPGTILSWSPVQTAVHCRSCHWSRQEWGVPTPGPCPQCGGITRPETTLEVNQAPQHTVLSTIGIAPREILAVRTRQGYDWIELAQTPNP